MHVEQRLASRRKAIAFAKFVGQKVRHIPGEVLERVVNDPAKDPGADSAHGLINRNDAAHLGGVRNLALLTSHHFDLRVHHFQPAGTVSIAINLAVEDQPLALLEASGEIAAVEKARVQHAGLVPNGYVKDGAAAAHETHGPAATGGNLRADGVHLARNQSPRCA